jgi:hypothetical protein
MSSDRSQPKTAFVLAGGGSFGALKVGDTNKTCSLVKQRRLKVVTGQPNTTYASPPCLINE